MKDEENLKAAQLMQEYIEENLNKKITLKEIADRAGYSPWHAGRIFKEQTGKTLFEYIRVLRLTKAALILRKGEEKIIDVAMDFVFDSHEGFTRAFTKEFGISPKTYSKKTPPIKLFFPSKVFDAYKVMERRGEKKMILETKSIFVQVIERPKRKVILKRGKEAEEYFKYCEEVGCDVWGLLQSIKSIIGEPVCLWLPKKYIASGTSEYVQGVEVPTIYNGITPDGFDVIELPAANYLMFKGEPFAEKDYCAAIEEVQTAITKYDPAVINAEWDQENPRIQLEPIGTRGYIELLPIK